MLILRSLSAFGQRFPLSLRVAFVMAPVILGAQLLTIHLMREYRRPIVAYYTGPGPIDPDRPDFRKGALPRIRGPALALPPPFPGGGLMLSTEGALRGLPANGPWSPDMPASMRPQHARLFRAPPLAPPIKPLLALFAVTTLLVWLSARWVTRPLARLSDAAEALGRDMEHSPLAEQGPPEVRRAARAFNGMQDRLRRFVKGRADALLAMSHDLRTPITRLRLRVELLPDEHRLGIIEDVQQMQSRVEHALGFMQGVHQDEPMRKVDLVALVSTICERHLDMGADVRVSGSSETVSCRPSQFERALTNLIDNAVRYGGSTEVELSTSGASIVIAVRDRGPGVPPHLMERLTEPFFRVEGSRSRESGGSGLGLAITKDIVEAHGGELILNNRDSGGFEAIIKLPRR